MVEHPPGRGRPRCGAGGLNAVVGSFLSAVGAAFAFGVASLLQEEGARRSPRRDRPGLRLLAGFLRQPVFVAGTLLDVAGFVLTFVALRSLPLFAVEATVSSSIAVTAIGSALRGERLARTGRAALGAIVVGLALVGSAALPEPPPTLSGSGRLALLAGVPVLALLGSAAGRRAGGRGGDAAALGGLAGLGFALFGVSSRVLPDAGWAGDPLLGAAVAYVVLGVLFYGAALQRGSVTGVTASTVAAETVLPALAGLALADGARAGLGPMAAAGFLLTTAATLALVLSCGKTAGQRRQGPEFCPEGADPGLTPSRPVILPPLLPS